LIIAILAQEFVQGETVRSHHLQLQLKPDGSEQFGYFGEAHFTGAPVLKRLKRSPADARSTRKRHLAKLEILSALSYLLPYGKQVQHAPNILVIHAIFKRFA
jgi:hypothetical protein